MKIAVRHSLIAVALLGAVTCFLALYLLTRLLAYNSAQRFERSKDLVTQQLTFQRVADAGARSLVAPVAIVPPRLGMRAGYLPRGATADIIPELDPVVRDLLTRVLRSAASSTDGVPVVEISKGGETEAVAGAVLTPAGDLAWTAHPFKPPPGSRLFRFFIVTLGLAGLALVGVSAHLTVSMNRGALLLKQSLLSLSRDLAAPVPRPAVRELSEVAEGIAGLVSELRRAQEEQARLSRVLAERERLASLGRVTAGVAHEVRNPLAAIKLRVDLIRSDPAVPTAVGSELGEVSEEISRLDRLVSDLLVIAGRRTGPRSNTDLHKLAQQRVCAIEPWAQERGVAISVSGSANANVDVDALGRVLDNLLRNAVEASDSGSAVEVGIDTRGEDALVMVQDSGAGVDTERVGELFEPFFTTKPEGMGLGLALSKAIIKAHGGLLTYERQGNKTRFQVTLPPADQPRDSAAAATEIPLKQRPAMNDPHRRLA